MAVSEGKYWTTFSRAMLVMYFVSCVFNFLFTRLQTAIHKS